ncbi:MAG TPA: 5-oxoprolinase subunit PxpA [Thermoanaerobaculia bacterium]|nr:5-oxoprolinase subunit PxpA [Thermoanaerobaculia bacterium]
MTEPVREFRKQGRWAVDLNFDGGEGGDDAALMRSVSTVNIACGGHAGDEDSMRRVVCLALAKGVTIHAHPSYEDRANFGRREVALPPAAIENLVKEQVEALRNIVREEEGELTGVKPHGALYHAAAASPAVASAVARAVWSVSRNLVLVSAPGSKLLDAGRALGLAVAAEGFVDRGYEADGSLIPRGAPGALVEDPEAAARCAVSLVLDRQIIARNGQAVPLAVDTLCVHGDTPNASAIAAEVRAALVEAEIVVRSLKGWRPSAEPGVSGPSARL